MDSILKLDSYRDVLSQELEKRSSVNPSYSQRAFARDLGIHSGRLSQILNGKQGLSRRYAKLISKKLGFSDLEANHFSDLVIKQHARSPIERTSAGLRLAARKKELQYRILENDQFSFIADWYHIAILELSKLGGFQSDPKWIARALGVSALQIKEALFTLERLGFVAREGDIWKLVTRDTFTPGGVPSFAIKQFHSQILEKAKSALRQHAVETREFTATMIAVDQARIPEVKKRIEVFWKSIDDEFGQDEKNNDLYCLGIQFFSLLENHE